MKRVGGFGWQEWKRRTSSCHLSKFSTFTDPGSRVIDPLKEIIFKGSGWPTPSVQKGEMGMEDIERQLFLELLQQPPAPAKKKQKSGFLFASLCGFLSLLEPTLFAHYRVDLQYLRMQRLFPFL